RHDPVCTIAVAGAHRHLVEVRTFRGPGHRLVEVDPARDVPVLVGGEVHRLARAEDRDGDRRVARRVAGELRRHVDAGQTVATQRHAARIRPPAGFQPHRLPDAGRGGERDAVIVVAGDGALFAVRDGAFVRRGHHRDLEVVCLARGHHIGTFDLERFVAADLLADDHAVDTDDSTMVHGTGTENLTVTGPGGRRDHRATIYPFLQPRAVHARGRGLPGERHGDRPLVPVGTEVPATVEVEPPVG